MTTGSRLGEDIRLPCTPEALFGFPSNMDAFLSASHLARQTGVPAETSMNPRKEPGLANRLWLESNSAMRKFPKKMGSTEFAVFEG